MSHLASAIADLYDHEQEPSAGRRRREAPDWGGDDLFTGTPRRRRFERAPRGEHPARLRDTMEHPVQRRTGQRARRPDLANLVDLGELGDLLAPPAETPPAGPAPSEARRPAGRRTVTITGHPDATAVRRRPAPTMDERLIGSRPERIAAYAFGLGMLLILIAFLTANA
jgi:hypothetical protein